MTTIKRKIFFVSDSTGITVETLGQSLISQFSTLEPERVAFRFVDNEQKALAVREAIELEAQRSQLPVIVFSTLVNEQLRQIVHQANCHCYDLFATFLPSLAEALQLQPHPSSGRTHGMLDDVSYTHRMDAVNYALRTDDGVRTQDYNRADIILVGVSRSGKTPTSLYLALHYELFVANYPMVEEELDSDHLPAVLEPYRDKLFGLLVTPERLQRIRSQRRPDSQYASLSQCQYELRQIQYLYQKQRIPYMDVTSMSVEEIATNVIAMRQLKKSAFVT